MTTPSYVDPWEGTGLEDPREAFFMVEKSIAVEAESFRMDQGASATTEMHSGWKKECESNGPE